MKKIPVRHIAASAIGLVPLEGFKIRDLHQVLAGNDLVHDLHRHDFYFVLAIRNGAGTHHIDFVSYPVTDHSIFILRPGQVHQLELMRGTTGYLLEFSPAFYAPDETLSTQRLIRASHKNFCQVESSRSEKLLAILENIYQEFSARQQGFAEMIKANLDIFFIEFIRQGQNTTSKPANILPYAQERFDDFMDLLGKRVSTLKQVSQYADLMNLSTYQLNAIIKDAVGKSASAVISEQIILEAKRYLLATSNQVKDIADQLGYEDISYFIRFFKKHTGFTPEAFRKNFQ